MNSARTRAAWKQGVLPRCEQSASLDGLSGGGKVCPRALKVSSALPRDLILVGFGFCCNPIEKEPEIMALLGAEQNDKSGKLWGSTLDSQKPGPAGLGPWQPINEIS